MRRRTPREVTEADLARLNLGRRYWPASLDGIHDRAQHKPVIVQYCTRIHHVRRNGIGLLLWGPNSRGKTWSAAAILKHATSWGYSGYLALASQLKQYIIEGTVFEEQPDGGVLTVEQRCREVDFLVLDDVGKEHRGASGFAETVFENLLRHRTRELLPTIVTTNLSLTEFAHTYGKSAFEIGKESMVPLQVKGIGESFRDDIGRRAAKELE